jgi:hypothetical protein
VVLLSVGRQLGLLMNKKQQKILDAIFEDPIRANIGWRDLESLFVALDAEVTQGSGSRVRVALNGARATFHKPHPEKVVCKGAVRSARDFLSQAGITP